MITRHDMFDPLLEALPAFRTQWEAFVAYWKDNPNNTGADPRDLPNYLLLGDLAHYLADLLEAGHADDVARALAVCERWLLEGEHYVKEAATVGLIEDLQNVAPRAATNRPAAATAPAVNAPSAAAALSPRPRVGL